MKIRSKLLSGWLGLSLLLIASKAIAQVNTSNSSTFFSEISAEDTGFDADRLQRLSDMLYEYSSQQRISGAVTLVLRDGQVLFFDATGYRDVETGDEMPHDAIFRIASQTKAIVSVGVMILQEQGKLLISDPVGRYLPEYMETTVAEARDDGSYEVVPANSPITIRQLLKHTSGIGYGYGTARDLWEEADIQGWYFAHRDEPVRETIRRLASLPMESHPGESYVYGYSTDILGALIEVVSGVSLEQFLQEEILDPLGMADTHFYLPQDKTDRLATVYSATEDRGIERAPDPGGNVGQGHYVNGPQISFSGGAGLLSTAEDYARFLQMLLNSGELDGERILSPSTVELMTVNHLDGIDFRAGAGFGLGFEVVQDIGLRGLPGAVGDFGWGGAYHSTYWVSPNDGLVVVFLTQLIPATGSDLHGKIRTLLYQAMID
ncbi:MAG: beta-lactamase family protein [Balneolaceae bacterium]|nr:beta-lactamase family protein [Balneolaceae bacterium]